MSLMSNCFINYRACIRDASNKKIISSQQGRINIIFFSYCKIKLLNNLIMLILFGILKSKFT